MSIKMRVMFSSKKKKMETFANAIGEACKCSVYDIPPAYPADKERLVLIGVSLKGAPSDEVRRFCSELYPSRTQNVALFIDGPKDSAGEKILKETLRQAGTNVIDETYYVKCGLFGKSITLEERQAIVDWSRKIISIVSEGK